MVWFRVSMLLVDTFGAFCFGIRIPSILLIDSFLLGCFCVVLFTSCSLICGSTFGYWIAWWIYGFFGLLCLVCSLVCLFLPVDGFFLVYTLVVVVCFLMLVPFTLWMSGVDFIWLVGLSVLFPLRTYLDILVSLTSSSLVYCGILWFYCRFLVFFAFCGSEGFLGVMGAVNSNGPRIGFWARGWIGGI